MNLNIPIDQRTHKAAYQRVKAQVHEIRRQLATNGVATIKIKYAGDAEAVQSSIIGDDNIVMLRADGETLAIMPKQKQETE